jgi:hypothetical protein
MTPAPIAAENSNKATRFIKCLLSILGVCFPRERVFEIDTTDEAIAAISGVLLISGYNAELNTIRKQLSLLPVIP